MIITISGTPGSGKSTIGKKLAASLHYPRFDMGAMMRQTAHQKGMSLSEYNRVNEKNPRGDRAIDAFQKKLGRTTKRAVVEGRLSFYFIPESVKIFLAASQSVGAKRIWSQLQKTNTRNEGHDLRTLQQVQKSVQRRMAGDRKRYQQYYKINPFLKRHYDLWIDTSNLSPAEVFARVRKFVVEKLKKSASGTTKSKNRIIVKKNGR